MTTDGEETGGTMNPEAVMSSRQARFDAARGDARTRLNREVDMRDLSNSGRGKEGG